MKRTETVIIARYDQSVLDSLKSRNSNGHAMPQTIVATVKDARVDALNIGKAMIADSEMVSSVRLSESTDAGWVFKLTIVKKEGKDYL